MRETFKMFISCGLVTGMGLPACSAFYQGNHFLSGSLPPNETAPLHDTLEQGKTIRICTEGPAPQSRATAYIETKLGLASWAEVISPQNPRMVFEKFEFTHRRYCPDDPHQIDLVIMIPGRYQLRHPDFPAMLFNRASMSCQRSPVPACHLNDWNASILQVKTETRPARLLYSPHAIWLNIVEDATHPNADGLQQFTKFYKHLIASPDKVGIDELIQLNAMIKSSQLWSRADQNFHTLRSAFFNGDSPTLPEMIYSAEVGFYSYLLRDLGFALGLHPQPSAGVRTHPRPLFLSPVDIKFARQTIGFQLLAGQLEVSH